MSCDCGARGKTSFEATNPMAPAQSARTWPPTRCSHLPSDLVEQFHDKGMHQVKGRQQSVRVFGIDRRNSDALAGGAQSA